MTTEKPELVLVGPLIASAMAGLEAAFTVHRLYEAANRDRFLAERAGQVRAIVTDGALGASRVLVEALPRVEIVSIFGVGLDAVDLDHARKRGIAVTNTPGVLTDDVADLAVLLMLAVSRRLIVADRFVRQGRWGEWALPLASRFTGRHVGIVGLGRVGRALAARCRAFDCRIAYVDPLVNDPQLRRFDSMLEMANAVDILVVAAAGGDDTRHLIDATVMAALGPGGALINVARGSIVDEPALVAALASGRLGAAGLDVFADEPNVPEALRTMDNVVLSPHRASATVETRVAMGGLLVDNLTAYFSGRPPPTPVA